MNRHDAPPPTVEEYDLRDAIVGLLGGLTAQQRDVLIRRYGIGRARPETLAETAAALHVSRERVRQIEARALRTLINRPWRLRRSGIETPGTGRRR